MDIKRGWQVTDFETAIICQPYEANKGTRFSVTDQHIRLSTWGAVKLRSRNPLFYQR